MGWGIHWLGRRWHHIMPPLIDTTAWSSFCPHSPEAGGLGSKLGQAVGRVMVLPPVRAMRDQHYPDRFLSKHLLLACYLSPKKSSTCSCKASSSNNPVNSHQNFSGDLHSVGGNQGQWGPIWALFQPTVLISREQHLLVPLKRRNKAESRWFPG